MSATPEAISRHLLHGETAFWSGRPPQGLRPFWRDVILIPFSLTWGGGSIMVTTEVFSTPGLPFPPLWIGGFFSLYGLFMMVGRFLVDAYARGTTYYAVTNRRILIVRTGLFASQRSFRFDSEPKVTLWWSGRKRGTLLFGSPIESGGIIVPETFSLWALLTLWIPGLYPFPQFFAIRDAPHVVEVIQAAAAGIDPRVSGRAGPRVSGSLSREPTVTAPPIFGQRPIP